MQRLAGARRLLGTLGRSQRLKQMNSLISIAALTALSVLAGFKLPAEKGVGLALIAVGVVAFLVAIAVAALHGIEVSAMRRLLQLEPLTEAMGSGVLQLIGSTYLLALAGGIIEVRRYIIGKRTSVKSPKQ